MSDLRCPDCEYELKGLAAEDDFLRCPECGRFTTLSGLAADIVARRRERRRRFHGSMLALAMLAFAVLLTIGGDSRPDLDTVGHRLRFLGSGLGIAVSGYLALMIFLVSGLPWPSVWRRWRLVFAVVAAGMLFVVPWPFTLPALLAWVLGFRAWGRG